MTLNKKRLGKECVSVMRMGEHRVLSWLSSSQSARKSAKVAGTLFSVKSAKSTVTLGLPKPGLLVGDGPRLAGEVWVVDIGVPFEAYAALGIDVPQDLFAHGDQVRLDSFR